MLHIRKATLLALVGLLNISSALAEGRSYGDDKNAFSACIAQDPPMLIVEKLQLSPASVEARTDDSPITAAQRAGLKKAALEWERCLSALEIPAMRRYMQSALGTYVDGATGKHKTWMTFQAARAADIAAIQADIEREVREAMTAEQVRQERLRAEVSAAAETDRRLEAEKRYQQAAQERQEQERRAAGQQQFINGLMLLNAARPAPTPMPPPSFGTNCQSRSWGGTVYTNCN